MSVTLYYHTYLVGEARIKLDSLEVQLLSHGNSKKRKLVRSRTVPGPDLPARRPRISAEERNHLQNLRPLWSMDALKAQIASQKRKIAQEHNDGNKYMRRGDIEAITTQQYARELQERTPDIPESNEHIQATSQNMAESARDDVMTPNQDELVAQKTLDPSKDKIMCRLREKSEPICLFGESDEDRIQRLHALEQASEREIKGKGVFIENSKNEYEGGAGEKSVSQGQEKDTPSKDRVPARMREGVGMHTVMDLKLIWTDTPRVYPIIYYTLKGILEDWETELEQRPDIVKRSEKGQKMSELHAQTVVNLKPLFKLLRRRSMESDVLLRIAEIVHYMQQREYRKANDSYLQLSIGNAPWPIGITMAGYVRPRFNVGQDPRKISR